MRYKLQKGDVKLKKEILDVFFIKHYFSECIGKGIRNFKNQKVNLKDFLPPTNTNK